MDFRKPSFLCESVESDGGVVVELLGDLLEDEHQISTALRVKAAHPDLLTVITRFAVLSPISSANISTNVR
jgi:hypothetical protein